MGKEEEEGEISLFADVSPRREGGYFGTEKGGGGGGVDHIYLPFLLPPPLSWGAEKGGFFLSSSAREVLLIPGQVANFPSSFFPQGLYNANYFSDPNDFELFFLLRWEDSQKWL